MKLKFTTLLFALSILFCHSQEMVDKHATAETKALYSNLKKVVEQKKVIFGQQDATAYGLTWMGDADRSDVKDICGEHPALLGLDFMGLTNPDASGAEYEKKKLTKLVKDFYAQGGVITFCWHMSNPATDGSFNWSEDSTRVVSDLLVGKQFHDKYKQYLHAVASAVKDFRGENGELIPIIFRPFHEFDGDWFWWGNKHCTTEEFVALWQFTVEYLRDDLEVRNFIYAFSPDCRFSTREEFLSRYPGDEYVDILGMDNYWDFRPDGNNNPQLAEDKLQILADLAEEKNKVAALTETGLESVTQSNWFTSTLLPILQRVPIAYAQVWRNAHESSYHYYAPTKGHAAEKDFVEFCKQENILMINDLPNMYE